MQCPAGFGRANEPGIDHADSNGSRPESPRRLGLDNDHGGVPCMAPTCALPLPDQRAVRAFRVTASSVVGQPPPAENNPAKR